MWHVGDVESVDTACRVGMYYGVGTIKMRHEFGYVSLTSHLVTTPAMHH